MAAKLKKFVTIKSFTSKTNVGVGFNVLRKAINRTGSTLDGVSASVHAQKTLLKFQADYLSDSYVKQITIVRKGTKQKNTFFKDFNKRIKRMFAVKKRQKAEDAGEDGIKEGRTQTDKLVQKIGKPITKFMGFFGNTIGRIVKWFVIFGALDFVSKHPEKVAKLGRLIFAIGKFGFNIAKLGVGSLLTGLTNLVGDYSDKGAVEQGMRKFLGVFQLLGGIAALKTVQYLVMPWKLISDVQGINSIFAKSVETSEEIKASSKARLKGYKDAKTGVIYTEKEYKAMKKSAQRADAKRGARAGKGMKSDLYGKQFDKRFQGVYGNKRKTRMDRMTQKGRIFKAKAGKGISKFAKANSGKIAGGLSVLGGGLRIASGLASGEEAGTAIGAGVGQAAGGLAGAAALTAVAPFLGPFAPMIGSAVGGFLGEWVGKIFGKMLQPVFDPIGRAFKMYFKLAMDITKPFRDNLGPLLGAVFQVIGGIGEMIFKSLKPLLDFTGFVLKLAGGVLAETINFVVNNAKRLMDPKSMVAGFFDAITLNAFDFDDMNEPKPEGKAAGGPITLNLLKPMAKGGLVNPEVYKPKLMAEGGFYKSLPDLPQIPQLDKGGFANITNTYTSYSSDSDGSFTIGKTYITPLEAKEFLRKHGMPAMVLMDGTVVPDFGKMGGDAVAQGLRLTRDIMIENNAPKDRIAKLDEIMAMPDVQPAAISLMINQLVPGSLESAMMSVSDSINKKKMSVGGALIPEMSTGGGLIKELHKFALQRRFKDKLESVAKFIIPQEERRQRFMDSLRQAKNNVVDFVKGGIDTVRGIEPTAGTSAKMVKGETQMQEKAQRDSDEEMKSEVVVLKQSVTQPIINNVASGQPKFVYINSKSPMLTEFV